MKSIGQIEQPRNQGDEPDRLCMYCSGEMRYIRWLEFKQFLRELFCFHHPSNVQSNYSGYEFDCHKCLGHIIR